MMPYKLSYYYYYYYYTSCSCVNVRDKNFVVVAINLLRVGSARSEMVWASMALLWPALNHNATFF